MTRLNRVYERRLLLYIGNKDGLISYGIGRGPMYEDSYNSAIKELKKNLICIKMDADMTCASDLKSRFNDYRLYIQSTYNAKLWGNPIMCLMLRYAGIYHGVFSIISRQKDPYAMIFAFFKAVTKNVTPTDVLELNTEKSFKYYWGRPHKWSNGLQERNH